MVEKKTAVFFTNLFLFKQMKQKIIIVFTKKNIFLWFWDFLGEKVILDYL